MRFVGSDGRGGSNRLDPACDTRAVGGWTAIVLAGSRNERDLLAAHFEVTSKALVPLGGEPMVGRVVSTLLSCPSVGRVVIVAQDPHNLCRGELEWIAAAPGVSLVESPHGIGTSLAQLAGTEATPLPVL